MSSDPKVPARREIEIRATVVENQLYVNRQSILQILAAEAELAEAQEATDPGGRNTGWRWSGTS